MKAVTLALPTLEELRRYVRAVLYAPDWLEPGRTPLYQGLVTRRDRPCGLFFQVQGPRQLKTYALWAGKEGRILFYDSQGQRFAQTRLSEGPSTRELA